MFEYATAFALQLCAELFVLYDEDALTKLLDREPIVSTPMTVLFREYSDGRSAPVLVLMS